MPDGHLDEEMLKRPQARQILNYEKATLSPAKVLGEVCEGWAVSGNRRSATRLV